LTPSRVQPDEPLPDADDRPAGELHAQGPGGSRSPDGDEGLEPDIEPGEGLSEENPGLEDAQWVAEVLQGRPAGFEKLVRKYQRQAMVVSYRLLGNHEDARDITQDAFLKAYRSLDTLERPAAFGGWLMRIVTNLSLNYRRGRRLRMAQPIEGAMADQLGSPQAVDRPMRGHGSDSLAQSGSPERAVEGKELGDALQAALNQLPEKQRQALVLFTMQEMPQKEVAEALGCSVEAVKWHVFQGRKKLRELLKDTM
jgi:RNA polymerase sigma-70 factor (ECF subfamily)